MALDFHRLDTDDYLFGLEYGQYLLLSDIFETFRQWTGLVIDPFQDMTLTTMNQATLLQVIDQYIERTDLNTDKKKTAAILEFSGLLRYFMNQGIDLQLAGD